MDIPKDIREIVDRILEIDDKILNNESNLEDYLIELSSLRVSLAPWVARAQYKASLAEHDRKVGIAKMKKERIEQGLSVAAAETEAEALSGELRKEEARAFYLAGILKNTFEATESMINAIKFKYRIENQANSKMTGVT